MTDEETAVGRPLPCPTIVYRSIFRKWIEEDGEVAPAAFIRVPRDSDGLSLFCSPEVAWTRLNRVQVVLSLHVGRVPDLGTDPDQTLEVVDDPRDAHHALITGLPWPHESDEAQAAALRLAHALLAQARVVSSGAFS